MAEDMKDLPFADADAASDEARIRSRRRFLRGTLLTGVAVPLVMSSGSALATGGHQASLSCLQKAQYAGRDPGTSCYVSLGIQPH